jgi:hypothetical protein
MLQEGIAAWRTIGATGKAEQLSEKHEWLLKLASTSRTNEVGCQTVDSLLQIDRAPDLEQNVVHSQLDDTGKQHWLDKNEEKNAGERALDISGMGLGKTFSHFYFEEHKFLTIC